MTQINQNLPFIMMKVTYFVCLSVDAIRNCVINIVITVLAFNRL